MAESTIIAIPLTPYNNYNILIIGVITWFINRIQFRYLMPFTQYGLYCFKENNINSIYLTLLDLKGTVDQLLNTAYNIELL